MVLYFKNVVTPSCDHRATCKNSREAARELNKKNRLANRGVGVDKKRTEVLTAFQNAPDGSYGLYDHIPSMGNA